MMALITPGCCWSQPTHNKQDFDDTKGWRKLLHSVSRGLQLRSSVWRILVLQL